MPMEILNFGKYIMIYVFISVIWDNHTEGTNHNFCACYSEVKILGHGLILYFIMLYQEAVCSNQGFE
jgi:hypothetical protein